MSELQLRLILVAMMAGVVVIAVLAMRRLAGRGWRKIRDAGLDPGVYLFTSVTCETCQAVRQELARKLGAGGFVEITWESRPDLLTRLDVAEVPSTLVVTADGLGTLYRGAPGGDRLRS